LPKPEIVAAAPVANVNSAPPPRLAKSPVEADVPLATLPYQDLLFIHVLKARISEREYNK